MSMISILIDDLRQMADGQATYRDARVVMLQAADTIWELRDDLQQENAENALLREHITTQKQTIQAYRDESREWREVSERAQAENAKLRELAADLAICACGKYCYGCPHQYDGCDRDQRLRELGIEMDG